MRTDLRLSASYAGRFMNCSASADLKTAIPNFEVKESKRQAASQGTVMHSFFEAIILEGVDLIQCAAMLRDLADVRGKARIKLIENEKDYIIWWFMKEKCAPVLEHEHLRHLKFKSTNKETGEEEWNDVPPLPIRFIAEALEYVALLLRQGGTLHVEQTCQVEWLETKPYTTVDIMIRNGNKLHILDLKMGSIKVDVFENKQLLYYAAAFRDEESEITLHILQRNNIDHWSLTSTELMFWKNKILKAERAVLQGELEFNPGDHCTFCPANPRTMGDKGYPHCPAQIELLYGPASVTDDDEGILND